MKIPCDLVNVPAVFQRPSRVAERQPPPPKYSWVLIGHALCARARARVRLRAQNEARAVSSAHLLARVEAGQVVRRARQRFPTLAQSLAGLERRCASPVSDRIASAHHRRPQTQRWRRLACCCTHMRPGKEAWAHPEQPPHGSACRYHASPLKFAFVQGKAPARRRRQPLSCQLPETDWFQKESSRPTADVAMESPGFDSEEKQRSERGCPQ